MKNKNEQDHNNHIRAALQDALLLHAPHRWPDKKLEAIEKRHMTRVMLETAEIPLHCAATLPILELHAEDAIEKLLGEIGTRGQCPFEIQGLTV